jgi:precorrin-6Y C5,15-methyltransferase (decarboxylating)
MMVALPGPEVHVIGLGVSLGRDLGSAARDALAQAEVVIGAERHLAAFPDLKAEKYGYPSPLSELGPLLQRHAGRRIVLLASGDPLFYGIGACLIRYLDPDRLVFYPHISSIQAAFARIKRPWQQARVVSLHGRPLNSLRAVLQVNRLYALLTDQASNPTAIARLLIETGFEDSTLWVAEDLGMPQEQTRCFQAKALTAVRTEFSTLNVVIAETRGPGRILPEFPGIPDEHFITGSEPGKGLLSKREVRLNILSLLAPRAKDIGWDVGAGCGGVAVEWARWNPLGRVYAVECDEQRRRHLEANRVHFGVIANLHIIPGRAPEVLNDLPNPDAVFIGGSQGQLRTLLDTAWQRLSPGGRLVASAVTEDSRMDLYAFVGDRPAHWTEIRIARGDRLAGQRLLRPQLPVLLMQLEKPYL